MRLALRSDRCDGAVTAPSEHRCCWHVALFAGALLSLMTTTAIGANEPGPISVNAVAIGVQSRTDVAIGMLEARTVLSPHLFLTAAPTILSAEGAETERQLRLAATLVFPLGPLRLDDRNLWVFSDAGTARYRNRLRLTVPVEVRERVVRFQLVDEAFYEQGGRGWFRNMMGAGVGVDVTRSVSVDAYGMLLDEDHRTQTSIFFVVLSARLF